MQYKKFQTLQQYKENVQNVLESSEVNSQNLKNLKENFKILEKSQDTLQLKVNMTDEVNFELISENLGKEYVITNFDLEDKEQFQVNLINNVLQKEQLVKLINKQFHGKFQTKFLKYDRK